MAYASAMFIDKGGFVGPDSMIFYNGDAVILKQTERDAVRSARAVRFVRIMTLHVCAEFPLLCEPSRRDVRELGIRNEESR